MKIKFFSMKKFTIVTSIVIVLFFAIRGLCLSNLLLNINNKKIIGKVVPIISYIKEPRESMDKKSYYRSIIANKTYRFEVFDFREEDYYEEKKGDVTEIEKEVKQEPMVNIDELGTVRSATLSSKNMIKNETNYAIDLNAVNSRELNIKLNHKEVEAIIYHTHATESYTPTKNNNYVASGTFRTLNTKCNMISVGEQLKRTLENNKIKTYHDTVLYDAASFNGAYSRSYDKTKENIKKYKSTKLVFDVHRDAIGVGAERYRPIVKVGDKEVAQILLVVGTDAGGLTHSKWRENLNFAIKLKNTADKLYPGLIRQINVRKERFNQNLSTGSLIVEMGATGNTVEEAILSAELFGNVVAKTL